MNNYSKYINRFLVGVLMILMVTGCSKIKVDTPQTGLSNSNVFNTDATAIAALTGIMVKISQQSYDQIGTASIGQIAGLSADELDLWPAVTSSANLARQAYYLN